MLLKVYFLLVTEFAKKTGDYTSLSATDVKVIALTYQLEKEKVGTEHLKEAPTIVKTINSGKRNKNRSKPVVGFYMPKKNVSLYTYLPYIILNIFYNNLYIFCVYIIVK